MRFEIQGKLRGSTYGAGTDHIIWLNGEIGGSGAAMLAARLAYANADGVTLGPVEGPYTNTEAQHRDSAISSGIVLADLFQPGYTYAGDVPVRPPIPPGAIG